MIRKNSRILFHSSLFLLIWFFATSSVFGQGLLQNPERIGLTQVWSKGVATGLNGKISGVHLHVSSSSTYQATDVVDRFGRRKFFSDIDTRPVSLGGYDQTQRLSEMKTAELKARGLEPRVEQQSIPNATLYIRSTTGTVTAMDAETGQIKWMVQAGTEGYPSYSVAATDDYVVALSSTKLFLIDAKTGQVLDTLSTRSIPSGTPTMDGDHIYVPTWRGLIEVYSTERFGSLEFTLGSTSPVVGTVTVCPDGISWASDLGDLYVGNRQRPGMRFRFQSPDTISSAPAYMNGMLFATSLDGFVYAIDDTLGNVKWRHSIGGPIDVSPLAVDGMVFSTTREGQLACLDAKTGEPKWLASGIKGFVSASDNRLYCATNDSQLAVIDIATGQRIGSQKTGVSDLAIVNTVTDRLYLARNNGTIRCLRESGRRWPIVRQSEVKADSDSTESSTEDPEEVVAEPDTTPSAGDDLAAAADDDVDVSGDAEDDMGDEDDVFGDFGDDAGGDFGDDMGMGDDEEDPFGDF